MEALRGDDDPDEPEDGEGRPEWDEAEVSGYNLGAPPDDDDDDGGGPFVATALVTGGHRASALPPVARPVVTRIPEVVDDFVRNFLVKAKMTRTLQCFETEWYEARPQRSGTAGEFDSLVVPDLYRQNADASDQLTAAQEDLERAHQEAEKARGAWERMKKERDFHRASHRRVLQEKAKLVQDLKRLEAQCSQYDVTIGELRRKYEVVSKDRALLRMERDKSIPRSQGDTYGRPSQTRPRTEATATTKMRREPLRPVTGSRRETPKPRSAFETPWPNEDHSDLTLVLPAVTPPCVAPWRVTQSHHGHAMSVSSIAVHPDGSTFATGSDDRTWRLWAPDGELILTGEGHQDWVGSVDYHPRGTLLVSASGDKTVKVWDLIKAKCVATYKDHAQGVWRACFNDTGDFVASCSLDHTARVWDAQTGRCRAVLRGHMDSVNGVAWRPGGVLLATASGDKSVSLWDPRTAHCSHTFYGHDNACNHVVFAPTGTLLLSSDADGKVFFWDLRETKPVGVVDCGPHPANGLSVDRSSSYFAVASDDGSVKLCRVAADSAPHPLVGHRDAALGVAFDPDGRSLLSCGSDATWKRWG